MMRRLAHARTRRISKEGAVRQDRLKSHPKPRVLAIGIEPIFGDFSTLPPGLTPEVIRATVDAQIERLRTLGYEVESCRAASLTQS